jgi:hypothetical protein
LLREGQFGDVCDQRRKEHGFHDAYLSSLWRYAGRKVDIRRGFPQVNRKSFVFIV